MMVDKDSARIKFPPPLMFLGTLLAGFALSEQLNEPRVPLIPHDLQNLVGWLALVAGAGTMLSAISLFKRENTAARPWKRSTRLVTDGVYRWTRNPMYLGMALIYAAVALLADELVVLTFLVPLVVMVDRTVIVREERYLARKFGTAYYAYKGNVRRWI